MMWNDSILYYSEKSNIQTVCMQANVYDGRLLRLPTVVYDVYGAVLCALPPDPRMMYSGLSL